MGSRGRRWATGAPERTHSTHSDTNSNATISNGNKNTNGNCGSGSGNVFHVEEVFAARKERAACGGPTDAGMGTEPNGRAGAKATATGVDLAAGAEEDTSQRAATPSAGRETCCTR